jgi:hypothetical protein
MNPIEDELIDFCYEYRTQYLERHQVNQREFDCLISLVENNDIANWEQLAEYGMYKFS